MRLERLSILLMLLGLCFATSSAQNRSTSPDPPTQGTAQVFLTPSFVPKDLAGLVEESDLIVDASVETILVSRWTNPAKPTSLETDVLLAVTKVFKGSATAKIIVGQPGG